MSKPGPKPLYTETFLVRLVKGTRRRIRALLKKGESDAAFHRTAIDNEIERRLAETEESKAG